MDIMMPEMDGLIATMKIREFKNIPVIMLSAKSEDTDKIMGLNMGADDYITKPFNPLELIARVRSQLRRYTKLGSIEQKENVFETGGLMIEDDKKRVTVDGEEVRLTPVQYKILKLLMENKGNVFSIDKIYEKVWNETAYNPENTVAVHIRKIREQIEINPKEPKYLKVVWGVGYKIEKI
jgi:DNA-binding response OmpR family regulator